MSAMSRGPAVWRRPLAGLSAAGLLAALALVPADSLRGFQPVPDSAITFHDGLTYYGKVRREGEVILDQFSGEAYHATAASSAFILDDGPHYLFFGAKQVRDAREEPDPRKDFVSLRRDFGNPNRKPLPKNVVFDGETKFVNGRRQVFFRDLETKRRFPIDQVMTNLNPFYVRLDAPYYVWGSHHLTSELGPDLTLELAKAHPDIAELDPPAKPGQPPKPGKPDIAKRLKLVRFLTQAGVTDPVNRDRWLKHAHDELDRDEQDLPGEKQQIDAARADLKALQADMLCTDIEQARQAGRPRWAKAALASIQQQFGPLGNKQLVRVAKLQGDAAAEAKQFEQACRYLDELPGQVEGEHAEFACEALGGIKAELSPEAADRLEPFVRLTEQAMREREQNRPASYTPTELTAFAVTGWLLGKTLAEPRIATARQLWSARNFLLEYLRTHDPDQRQRMLGEFSNQPPFDVLAQMVTLLPPPEPGDAPDPDESTLFQRPNGPPSMIFQSRKADLPACRTNPRYLLLLPPEYTPGRAYPVLIALAHNGQAPMDMIKGWGTLALRHGYILVAPEWGRGFTAAYEYRAEDRDAVLDTLRDLRQRYRVDADRVFLTGFGEGANLALDVGLSHPDLFAGVSAMGASFKLFQTQYYWLNARYLPLYLVMGDLTGEPAKVTRRVVEKWIPKGYPSLFVIYKGRAMEFFGGELPAMMDWMNAKRRPRPYPECGCDPGSRLAPGEGFQSLRLTDNRFYWLSAEELFPKYQLDGLKMPQPGPASMQARAEGNQIFVTQRGVKQLAIWLGRDMIDFDKPVQVNVNANPFLRGVQVKPNLGTMLEDLYRRGDQQRPYVARLDCKLAK